MAVIREDSRVRFPMQTTIYSLRLNVIIIIVWRVPPVKVVLSFL